MVRAIADTLSVCLSVRPSVSVVSACGERPGLLVGLFGAGRVVNTVRSIRVVNTVAGTMSACLYCGSLWETAWLVGWSVAGGTGSQ